MPLPYEEAQKHYEEARAKGHGGAVHLSAILQEELVWWWPDALARGIVAVIAGDGGVGKSTICMQLGAMVTRGEAPPGGTPFDGPRGLVIISAEESPSMTIAPRLGAMGADPERVLLLDPEAEAVEFGEGTDGAVRLDKMVAGVDAGMVILDTGVDLFADPKAHASRGEIGQFFRELGGIAGRHDCMVLVLHHFRKGATEERTIRSKVYGNGAYLNKPRMVGVAMTPDGAKAHETDERVLGFGVKSNISRRMVGSRVVMESVPGRPGIATCRIGPLEEDDLDRHLGAPLEDAPAVAGQTKVEKVRDLLGEWLAEGPQPATAMEQALEELGYREWAIKQGKKAAGVRSYQGEAGWVWTLGGDAGGTCAACGDPSDAPGVCSRCMEASAP